MGAITAWASVCFYYLIFMVLSPDVIHSRLMYSLMGSAALVALLLSPRTRQACQAKLYLMVALRLESDNRGLRAEVYGGWRRSFDRTNGCAAQAVFCLALLFL